MLIRSRASPKGFRKLLEVYPRIAISGVVKSGKSILTEGIRDREVLHTDELLSEGVPFKDVPTAVIERLGGKDRFVISGVQVPRTLRKGLEVDALVWLDTPRSVLRPPQEAFGKGIRQIMHKWRDKHPQIPVYFSARALHDHELERMPV